MRHLTLLALLAGCSTDGVAPLPDLAAPDAAFHRACRRTADCPGSGYRCIDGHCVRRDCETSLDCPGPAWICAAGWCAFPADARHRDAGIDGPPEDLAPAEDLAPPDDMSPPEDLSLSDLSVDDLRPRTDLSRAPDAPANRDLASPVDRLTSDLPWTADLARGGDLATRPPDARNGR